MVELLWCSSFSLVQEKNSRRNLEGAKTCVWRCRVVGGWNGRRMEEGDDEGMKRVRWDFQKYQKGTFVKSLLVWRCRKSSWRCRNNHSATLKAWPIVCAGKEPKLGSLTLNDNSRYWTIHICVVLLSWWLFSNFSVLFYNNV